MCRLVAYWARSFLSSPLEFLVWRSELPPTNLPLIQIDGTVDWPDLSAR